MKFTKYLWLPLVLIPTIYTSCSHTKVDREIDAKASHETATPMGAPLAAKGYDIIQSAPNLSAEQKQKLLGLHQKMAGDMTSLREEESKLKSVLFRSIIEPKFNNKEVERIKSRLISLDQKKMNMMFSALKETKKILGRAAIEDEKIYRMVDRQGLVDRTE